MAEYPYIHIALRGPSEGQTRTLFTYPAEDKDAPQWDSVMVEPGAAIKRFLNATECYVLQSSDKGHYISLITADPAESGKWMMVSILVNNGCSLTGRQVLDTLENLKNILIDNPDRTEQAVDVALIEARVPRLPVELRSWLYTPSDEEQSVEAGYRTYISPKELEQIFAFPSQPEYGKFRCVLVVSATTSLRPGVKMPRITVPVRHQYSVECPEDVRVSRDLVYDGDTLEITYEKEGYDSHREKITVGEPSAYTKVEGAKLMIRTAAQTGIRFVRRVRVKVVSSKGGDLRGYTITLNGRLINTMTPYIDFTPRDLPAGEEVDIRVESNNYKPLKLKYPTEEMLSTDELVLELQPVEQTVTLRLDFGDGRVFTQEISIEKNTPEYNRLHSGNFHGFRAHRQVTTDNTEVYNVDVRLTNPPVAPNFETGRDQQTREDSENRHRSPMFENISDESADEKPVVDTTLPIDPRREAAYDNVNVDTDDDGEDSVPVYRRKGFLWGVIGAIVIVAVVAAALLIPDSGEDEAVTTELLSEQADSIAAGAAAAPVAPATPEEQADIDYLNDNPVWNLSRLKSPMGTALAKAMTDGDLNALAENDYFAVRGRCSNAKAIQIVEMAWTAIGSPNERGNRNRLSNTAKTGEIDLHKLIDSMAKVRPSENPNESPRPQK
ncbi:MAG: hypothetical protein NC039_03245 [Muribaculaceae bacterium]|nr:hypothetical protein [Muribaculaceae bacterium]